MLTIRLSRIGKKNKPMYRLVISEKARDPYGRALEILGSYNPYTKELVAKDERIKHWLSLGAGMSVTVSNLLIEKEIIKGEKVKATKINKKKEKETKEKKKKEKTKTKSAEGGGEKEEVKTEEKTSSEDKKEVKVEEPKEEKKEPKQESEEKKKE